LKTPCFPPSQPRMHILPAMEAPVVVFAKHKLTKRFKFDFEALSPKPSRREAR
jgi:hypothetical protein